MKNLTLIAAIAALSVAACTKPAEDGKSAAKAETGTTAAAAPGNPAPAVSAGAVTAEFMVGKWATQSDTCKLFQDFKADGTVDGFFDSWKIEGSNLIVKIEGEPPMSMSVKKIDEKTIDTAMGSETKRLIRC